jgi:hypothetical protein
MLETYLKQKFLHARDKEVLSFLVSLQISRTRRFRNEIIEVGEKLMLELLKVRVSAERPDLNMEGVRVRAGETAGPLHQTRLMFDPEFVNRMMEALMGHIWILGINQTDRLFYTSDTPVVKQRHVDHPVLGTGGWASPGIEINFPISPRIVLMMCDREHWKELGPMDGRGIAMDDDGVLYCNSLQVRDSYRQVYSRTDDFELAREFCTAHPGVRSLEREVVEVVNSATREPPVANTT